MVLRIKRYRCVWVLVGGIVGTLIGAPSAEAQVSTARQWDELMLDAIRVDTPRPTVHARNLFHTSVAMYDAWAAYDPTAVGYLNHESASAADVEAARNEAISFAAYRVLSYRFAGSPGAGASLMSFDSAMDTLGYDRLFTSTVGNSPAAVGNRIAQTILDYGTTDGADEAGNYADTTGYTSVNPTLTPTDTGATLTDKNRWQPLVVNGNTQKFLTPHWGDVKPFALTRNDPADLYHDPGAPPQLGGPDDAEFKESMVRVIQFSSWLDPADNAMIDVSPGVIFNNTLGTNDGTGHAVNPETGLSYASNEVNRGDYGRVLAEFWADGPNSETPPGHWNAIANEVADNPLLEKRIGGTGPIVSDLEWDVKTYFALNGAVHDAAITTWGIKEAYDYVRPISAIRYMGGLGQSSDMNGDSYHADGLPLVADLIEIITDATTAIGQRHEHLAGQEGKVAIRSWRGHPDDPDNDVGGVDWILAEDWLPYQAENFVTPPFAAYTSGHSTFSRSAAEVLAAITGTPYFPGGLGEFEIVADALKFEGGPDSSITLEWATYFDASDEAGLSRLYGGIHVDADDFLGRIIGSQIGIEAYGLASGYFAGAVTVPEPVSLHALLGLGGAMATLRRRRR